MSNIAETPISFFVTQGDGDYPCQCTLVDVFKKSTGEVRYVVEDEHERLFICNAKELGVTEGWLCEKARSFTLESISPRQASCTRRDNQI